MVIVAGLLKPWKPWSGVIRPVTRRLAKLMRATRSTDHFSSAKATTVPTKMARVNMISADHKVQTPLKGWLQTMAPGLAREILPRNYENRVFELSFRNVREELDLFGLLRFIHKSNATLISILFFSSRIRFMNVSHLGEASSRSGAEDTKMFLDSSLCKI